MKFEPCVKCPAKIAVNGSCACPFTLVLHDLNPATNHFNLLDSEGGCCKAPRPENPPKTYQVDLVNNASSNLRDVDSPKMNKRKRNYKARKQTQLKDCSSRMKKQALYPENDSESKPKVKSTSVNSIKTTASGEDKTKSIKPEQKQAPDFEMMRVKELKDYMAEQGVPVSTYKKQDLIHLAHSLHEMDADIDPDYRVDSIEQVLKDRLTLPAGKNIPDPFTMKNVSNDFSSLPNFGIPCVKMAMFDQWRTKLYLITMMANIM